MQTFFKIVENDGGQIRFHFCLCLIKRFTRNNYFLHRYKNNRGVTKQYIGTYYTMDSMVYFFVHVV